MERDRRHGQALGHPERTHENEACAPSAVVERSIKASGQSQGDNVPLFKASSERALRDTLKECDGNGFKVHGFRTSLQEWGLETTKYDADLLEMCISHSTGGKTRKAYQRGDRLEQRTPVMQEWSDYLTG